MTLNDYKKNLIQLNRPALFQPTVVRQIAAGVSNEVYLDKTDSSIEGQTSLGISGSFKYDSQGLGLRSTQQLNVDWNDFSNHVFFNSAQVKTNVAFDKIINEFPFDGTKEEVELYFSNLTGFEKWIYEQFPKNKGYLYFSGSSLTANDTGTVVIVKDVAGAQFPTLSRNTTGVSILDPGLNSMTVETHIYVPSQSLGDLDQMVLSKYSGSNHGYGIVLETTASSEEATVSMLICSGALEDKISIPVSMSAWNHVAWVWDRTPGVNSISAYKDKNLVVSSTMPIEFGSLGTGGVDLFVGSGSAVGTFTPSTTFSGALDELRIWHNTRTTAQMAEYYQKPVFAENDLKLYFKFNEPSGSNSNLVIDYSDNSLHGKLNATGLTLTVREYATGSIAGASPMIYEFYEDSPVLFPNVTETVTLREELLLSGSNFDDNNPNLITKLIPPHYFLEGQAKDGLQTVEGDIVEVPEDISDNPRESQLGSTQVYLSLLYLMAKFFDELKLYVQGFSSLDTVDYDNTDTTPDVFLQFLAKREGIDLPALFSGASIPQFIEGQNLQDSISRNEYSLQYIQNQIWRRILTNLQDIIRSKGTMHSIKAFMRTIGINPDGTFRVREYGGPTKRSLDYVRENRFEVSTMIDFVSGGLLTSTPLSMSRTEPGWPNTSSWIPFNSALTSGSFTYEGIYRFPINQGFENSQSLARIAVTQSNGKALLVNTIAYVSGGATLYMRQNSGSVGGPVLTLPITGADLFDGKQWYVSFGRIRNDDPGFVTSPSGSYFLRLAKQHNGTILESYSTSSLFWDNPDDASLFSLSASQMIFIGSSSIYPSYGDYFLNAGAAPEVARRTIFQGRVGHIRFWSKYLKEEEWPEHVRNYRSVGVKDPSKNFNFATTPTGSWNRLRLDTSTDQITLATNASGEIILTDFTQNELVLSGTAFPATSSIIVPERFNFSHISPKIDEGAVTNKVRVRSFQELDRLGINTPWAELAPIYDIPPNETPIDSGKISIDFSVVDALDQDIITIFSSLEYFNNAIGNPELQFSPNYHQLEVLRDVYFNKLENKINFKILFDFYKWFDTSMSSFIELLLSRKAKFLGINYCIENHILERNRYENKNNSAWIGYDVRSGLTDTILLRLITGTIGR